MNETGSTAEREQRTVRMGAMVVHLGSLLLGVVLVAVGASWQTIAAVALVAAVAFGWAMKLYGDLQEQEMQDRAHSSARQRFVRPESERFDA